MLRDPGAGAFRPGATLESGTRGVTQGGDLEGDLR